MNHAAITIYKTRALPGTHTIMTANRRIASLASAELEQIKKKTGSVSLKRNMKTGRLTPGTSVL
jgi:hypothetical protein